MGEGIVQTAWGQQGLTAEEGEQPGSDTITIGGLRRQEPYLRALVPFWMDTVSTVGMNPQLLSPITLTRGGRLPRSQRNHTGNTVTAEVAKVVSGQ